MQRMDTDSIASNSPHLGAGPSLPRLPDNTPTASGSTFEGEGSAEPPTKKRRVRTGCVTCRRRKVKCDEKKDVCGDCSRLDLPCVWSSEVQAPARKVTRKRAKHACEPCRLLKYGCSLEAPCAKCRERGIDCVYKAESPREETVYSFPLDSGRSTNVMSPNPVASHVPTWDVSKDETRRLLGVYFERVYPTAWFSFLHRGTIMQEFEADALSPLLLKSMCVAASNYDTETGDVSRIWAQEAEAELLLAVRKPSVDVVASGLNLMIDNNVNGFYSGVWFKSGVLVRMMYALALNVESQSPLAVPVKESRRRMAWALFAFDTIMSGGVPAFQTIPVEAMRVQLPLCERDFVLGIPTTTHNLSFPIPPPDPSVNTSATTGLLSQYISIMAIRRKIFYYVANLSQEQSLPWEENSVFDSCKSDIFNWRASLGPEFELNRDTIHARAASRQLTQLFSLQIWSFQVSADLHRIAIWGFPEAVRPEILLAAPHAWIRETQNEAHRAAVGVAEACQTVLSVLPQFRSDDLITPLCVYECIRIQLWALENLYSPEERASASAGAVNRIQACLSVIKGSAELFPWVGKRVAHLLRKFRNSPTGPAATFAQLKASRDGDTGSVYTEGRYSFEIQSMVNRELNMIADTPSEVTPAGSPHMPANQLHQMPSAPVEQLSAMGEADNTTPKASELPTLQDWTLSGAGDTQSLAMPAGFDDSVFAWQNPALLGSPGPSWIADAWEDGTNSLSWF